MECVLKAALTVVVAEVVVMLVVKAKHIGVLLGTMKYRHGVVYLNRCDNSRNIFFQLHCGGNVDVEVKRIYNQMYSYNQSMVKGSIETYLKN